MPLTVKQAAASVGMGYDSLTELLRKYPVVRQWLGGTYERGAWSYPDASLGRFGQIADLYRAGVKLAGIAGSIETYASTPSGQTLPGQVAEANGHLVEAHSSQIAPIGQMTVGQLTIEAFAQMVAGAIVQSLPAPEDALLTLKAAHEQYGVSLAALRRLSVIEGGRRKVKRSEVLKLIRDL